MLIISGVGWKKPDREHIEDNLPTSSHTNQTIKDLWRNCTNTKCIFIYKCTTEVSHILAFYSENVFRKHSEHRCLFQLTSVFEGATESDISLRICNRKEPAVVGTLKHTHTYSYVCAVITQLFFKSDN